MQLDYHLVDVFTQTPLEGNALAVFTDATGLDTRRMQRIAREMNLSETTFVFPNESPAHKGIRVRIFTPAYEMEFAGHPTIGTAAVLRRTGVVAGDARSFVLQENIGEVPVRVGDDGMLWLTTPPIHELATFPREECAASLSLNEDDLLPNIPCELLSAGNPNIFVPLKDAATVDRAVIDAPRYMNMVKGREQATCFFIFAPTPAGAYSRMFSPEHNIVEDPATGSATGPLAAFMMKHGLVSPRDGTTFISEQGTKMGRRSLLHVRINGDRGSKSIEVGGHTTHVAVAHMTLPDEEHAKHA